MASIRNLARSELTGYGNYRTPAETPNLFKPIDEDQIDALLSKVNMNNTFLKMNTNDQKLINVMKETILYQHTIMKKREMLVHAITHNVKYLADLHRNNSIKLRNTIDQLDAVSRFNEKLQEENEKLTVERDSLRAAQTELDRKREELTKMAIESQANKAEIDKLYNENEAIVDKMEKLNLEVTVVVTEKLSLKKEYDRVEQAFRNLTKDQKELRVNYNLLVDENSNLTKQNSEYRGLILDNEGKLTAIDKEI